jgi:hypothetical protein
MTRQAAGPSGSAALRYPYGELRRLERCADYWRDKGASVPVPFFPGRTGALEAPVSYRVAPLFGL